MVSDAAWANARKRNRELSELYQQHAANSCISGKIPPLQNHLTKSMRESLIHRAESEPYWFQKIELFDGYYTKGWSDPVIDKMPYFGLPDDLTNKRVLDIGCAEGFFSFEAERRGAREVIAIDSFPDSVRRFNIVREAKQSNATAYLMNVYDLDPSRLGTFDVVLFYGVFYHLKHPQLALEAIKRVCVGDLFFQTVVWEEEALRGIPWAKYNPFGTMSGADNTIYDPTNFWFFNSACCSAMLDAVGFDDIKIISEAPKPFVMTAKSGKLERGAAPDQAKAPWC